MMLPRKRIQTLGGLAVFDGARPLAGNAQQPRRLAILAVLARAGDRGVNRDRLAGLLWEDVDEERARRSLNQALYALRQDLGSEEAILGTRDLRLNPEMVEVDLAGFETASASGALEEAARLYAGPFLGDFHLPGVPAFARWAEEERARLAADYRGILEGVAAATTKRGDWGGAVLWWRRLAALDPTDAEAAQGLMRALAAAGDTPSALRHAEIFATFRQQELELPSDPEVEALAGRIRRGEVGPEPATPSSPADHDVVRAPPELSPSPALAPTARRRIPVGTATLGISLLVGLVVLLTWHRVHRGDDIAGLKRLAVLPFENQGDSGDAYFADGITDELRGKLAAVPGLEVVASRSSNDYRRTTKSLPEIARDLGVDYLLIGKIRWQKGTAGVGRVQVSSELIRVTPDAAPTTKWQQPFDAALTDVFQVQADIASRVAQALNVALGAGVPQVLSARPTTSTGAYDDYLRANEYYDRETIPDVRLAIQLYHHALALDSTFGLAWARLARADAYLYWLHADPSPEQLARVERESRQAVALAPELPEAHMALGYFHYWGRRDYAQALEEFTLVSRRQPNNAEVAGAIGLVLRRRGRWEEAAGSLKRATELDPRSYVYLADLGETYLALRAYSEAEQALLRATALGPDLPLAYARLMQLYLNWEGSLERPRRVLGQALARMDLGRLVEGGSGRSFQSLIVADEGHEAAVALLTPASFDGDTLSYLAFKASVYHYRGGLVQARAYDDSTRTEALGIIARHEDDVFTHAGLAVADAQLGRAKEAIEAGQRTVAIMPLSVDALFGQAGPLALAEVYTVVGDTGAAVNQLEALLDTPSFLSGARLRADPMWTPLRSNPRFERLVAGR